MGYATTIYAIDLADLRSAIGSKDADLLRRTQSAEAAASDTASGVDPAKGPRLKVTLDGDLVLNGQKVSMDELKVALRQPEWKGTHLHVFHEPGKKRRPGPNAFQISQAVGAGNIAGIVSCRDEQEFLSGWQDDEISVEQVLQELIDGACSRPDCAHQYGYALEWLCRALGTHLATIEGKGRLRSLKLNTPLSELRPPVPLPENDDAPYISHLTADEAQSEAERLRLLDLSFSKSAEIERDRKTLLRCVEEAATRRLGIVAFYY